MAVHRGRPRKDPEQPVRTLKKPRTVYPTAWANTEEILIIQAERILRRRATCRARYAKIRQALQIAMPILFRKEANKQSNTLDDYIGHPQPTLGGPSSTECSEIP